MHFMRGEVIEFKRKTECIFSGGAAPSLQKGHKYNIVFTIVSNIQSISISLIEYCKPYLDRWEKLVIPIMK